MWSYCAEYPGAVISELPQPEFLEGRYDVFCQKFELGGQTGTYIETKAHVDRSARPVSDYPVSEFYFNCKIISVSDAGPSSRITADMLRLEAPAIEEGDAVLIRTGWDSKWFDSDFVSASPFISREAGEWLASQKIRLLGADFPRFDNPSHPEFPWDYFWDNVEFILAPVVNLSDAGGSDVKLFTAPIKIKNAYSAPTRAVLLESV